METTVSPTVSYVVGLVIILLFGVAIWTFIIADWIKCTKCRIRIASIKIPHLSYISARLVGELEDHAKFLNSKVCSKCWEDDLKQLPFPLVGAWWPGAIAEYFKNTPSFLAFVLSIASLALGILNFLR